MAIKIIVYFPPCLHKYTELHFPGFPTPLPKLLDRRKVIPFPTTWRLCSVKVFRSGLCCSNDGQHYPFDKLLYYIAESASGQDKANPMLCVIQRCFRDTWSSDLFLFFVNSINYFSCSMTKWLSVPQGKLWLIIDIHDFMTCFFPNFQFRDLRKINKDCERVKWEWWIFVSCHLQYCSFFSPLLSCFSDTLFTTFFFA